MNTLTACIEGIGFWADGLPSWQAAVDHVSRGTPVAEGGKRTAVIGNTATGPSLMVAADTASVPVAGAVKLRVVHSVTGEAPMEAHLAQSGAPVDSSSRLVFPFTFGVGTSGEFPGYVVRSPGSYRVVVTDLGTTTERASVMAVLAADQVYSVILTRTDGELRLVVVRET